jgi:hypothetical protein
LQSERGGANAERNEFAARVSNIGGQWRTTEEIGGSVLIYVLTLPFLKPWKDALRLVKASPAGIEPTLKV